MNGSIWSRWAEKTIVDLTRVTEDEQLTILTDDRVDPVIAESLFTCGVSRFREVQLVRIRTRSHLEEPVHLNSALVNLLSKSDVVIGACQTRIGQTQACQGALSAGTRFLLTEPEDRQTFLLNGLLGLDYPAMVRNAHRFCELLESTSSCRATSPSGTDLRFSIAGRPVVESPGMAMAPGVLNWFPGALVGVAPVEDSIEGVIAVDGSLFPYGLVEEPVILEINHGVIRDIRGGSLATQFAEWLASLDDDVTYRLCHFSVGFNPRAEMRGATMEDERCLGAITIGFGHQPPKFMGSIAGGDHHIDAVLHPLTISSDERKLLTAGSLNPELGFLAL